VKYCPKQEPKQPKVRPQLTIKDKVNRLRDQVVKERPELINQNGVGLSLINATKAKDFDRVASLLLQKGNPNQRDERGNTALGWAVVGREKFLIELLLMFEADPTITNSAGVSPLRLTIEHSEFARFNRRLEAIGQKFSWAVNGAECQSAPGQLEQETPSAVLKSAAEPSKNIDEVGALLEQGSDIMDGSRYLGYLSREGGSFGSYPGFDDYGDESMP